MAVRARAEEEGVAVRARAAGASKAVGAAAQARAAGAEEEVVVEVRSGRWAEVVLVELVELRCSRFERQEDWAKADGAEAVASGLAEVEREAEAATEREGKAAWAKAATAVWEKAEEGLAV